jgi:hypothetical protein
MSTTAPSSQTLLGPFTTRVEDCTACGRCHDGVTFAPVGWSGYRYHGAICPATELPVVATTAQFSHER